ncbi:nucleoporin p58/p45-like [Liolophura sinensis]|uniref:nucleoporin p58/p45-like n=1 Tax=Liolophura sinensis TaxID=3198878 RepID=UPI003158AE18
MATSGFTFGQTGTGTTTGTGLGGSTGFSFGAAKTTATTGTTGGFSFGTTPQQATTSHPAPTLGGFGFGAAAAKPATTTATTGLFGGLGGTAATTTTAASTGFTLGGLGAAAATTTSSATGFSFGGLGGTKTTTAGTGLTLGGLGGTTAASTGFSLGGTTTSAASGFSLGGTSATSSGLNLGGLLSSTTTTASGGLGGTATANIFSAGNAAKKDAAKGLGGVDPKTASSASGASTTNGKPSDAKTVKETPMPDLLVQTVEDFKKHIKDQKSVREDIARMSSKAMYKVQEDVVSLKQLLSVVSNGLQRNAAAIEKLKWEAAQELKNAEMAHRTKDIPAGLQYENTAPTEYYHRLVEDFEQRMQTYRQQIETMESHLACLHQPKKMSPQELVLLLRKIHETFLALAAQLHQVHEAVKTQKDHYLNYRKVFHADDKNVFEKYKKPASLHVRSHHTEIGGPNTFSGLSGAAAAAMASAVSRVQDPSGAPPAVGLGTAGLSGQTSSLTGGLFGSTGGTSSTGLGFGTPNPGFSFNTSSSTPAVKPIGLFGNLTASNTSGFGLGTPQTASSGTATPMPGGTPGFGTPGGAPVENKMFLLSRPPVKRGKR